jgi:hypothetical protein
MTPIRVGSALGLAIGTLAALWWFAALQFAVSNGFEAIVASRELLNGLWLTRALVVALTIPALAQFGGARTTLLAAGATILGVAPLLVLAGAASDLSLTQIVAAESALWLIAGVAWLLGAALRRGLRGAPQTEPVAFVLGIGLAAVIWSLRPLLVSAWIA